jgi:Holliday junction resolvase
MRRVGQVRRRDANERAIVEALEAVGCTVTQVSGTGAPDLLVVRQGRLYAFEVKGKAGRRTEAQQLSQWPIVRTVDAALQAVGIC